jgi:hypothetical protein
MTSRLSNPVVKDQCRCAAPRKDDTPAPNETRSTVAHRTRMCKQFRQGVVGEVVGDSRRPLAMTHKISQAGPRTLPAEGSGQIYGRLIVGRKERPGPALGEASR